MEFVNVWSRGNILRLYGCGTWSLTWRKEYSLMMLKNRMLRTTFGPKRDKVKEK